MINLEKIFKNHFNNERLAYDDLKKFSEDHLARITANNADGLLDPLIAPTAKAHTSYFGTIANKDVAAAVKEGMTMAVDQKIAAFVALVRRRESAVENAFGDDSPAYQEFFPHGLSEFNRATKANVATLMSRMVAAGRAHEKALGGEFVKAFKQIYDEYEQLREAQLGKKGNVSDLGKDRDEARKSLTVQLTRNMHIIAAQHPGEVQKCMVYFDQSILRGHTPGSEEPDVA